jgi:hypothetical protein
VLAAAPRRIEGPSYWTQSRIEFRRNPDVGRTVLVQRLAGFVDFSPDEPPVLEAGQVRIPLEPAWGSPWFRGESTGLSGDGWTQSNAALQPLGRRAAAGLCGRWLRRRLRPAGRSLWWRRAGRCLYQCSGPRARPVTRKGSQWR